MAVGEEAGGKKKRRGRGAGAGELGPAGELGAAFRELRVKRPRRAGGRGGEAGPGPGAPSAVEEGPSEPEEGGQSPPGSPVVSPARRGPAAHAYREMNRLLGRLHFERRQREGAPPRGGDLPPAG